MSRTNEVMTPVFEDLSVGDVLPELNVVVDEVQMFFFSAATYNGHRIHYDKEWARDKEGYENILVQGPLQSALLARMVTDWIGPNGRLASFEAQNRGIAYPGQNLSFGGRIVELDSREGWGIVHLEIFGNEADRTLMPGKATIEVPLSEKVQ